MVLIKKWQSVQLSKVAYMSSFVVDKSHELILKIKNKNIAIDATLGNGHDTLFLSSLFNEVHSLDIQKLAIKRSKERLKDTLNTHLYLLNHKDIDSLNLSNVDLILFNLGFLPGSDKKVTTSYESTLIALEKSLKMINDEGCIIIASYLRQKNGLEEYNSIINFLKTININYNEYRSEDSFDILLEIKKI